MDRDNLERAAMGRRNFLKLAGSGSFTAALVAGAGGMLWSSEAAAQTAREEKERMAAADHVMTLATAYVLGASRSYPIMQLDLKENIQNATNGKVYVKLAPGGQLGAGGALVQAVQTGTIQCAQHSLSNFAPFASAVDLINMPYFCGSNQRFTNLVNSDAWKGEVHPGIEAAGFKPLFYVVIDPRVVAVRKGGNKVITPADLKGVKFRVPGSKMLQQYYGMVGANPTPVAWGETPSAIKQGVADALDPSVGALFVFGFKDILSHVTFTQAVPDSQVYSVNLEWFNALPADVQEGIEFAGEMTAQQNLAKVPAARAHAMYELTKSGVEFHTLTDDQLAEWQDAGGYQRSEWDDFKVELAGSMETFNRLEEAAGTMGRYYVHDA
ncbi:MAG: TRAP transporter substrate-binding protein [Marinovum algicola]|jgi:TRAP-type C4-dicarboxylate transport system substrate-binding protein|uniref:TRAP-type C4-dicarboxylate transport system, substrate-binding protein n=1 Tax=Marinovum algicola TaxID=42444 RepID=A0A975ZM45_9RHOB|nr:MULTISPECIES: TRAP transporter substrate-binding protein [Marinovum]AKO96412.1 TRAP-type C4-dicarboxylate transport system, periplasmic component [Marinovum algicola DG 898]MDD9738892.1 TRAP transporter substrate-binding protein [Marinovum sp. SP66]MDD9743263.1 TRAP transporter substrate-binding protein [Marinovum sp. PR37]SEI87950.1 TRAP-type C4-dicarboxylate transport system, substrate-binding protein [Marinovum algicola]SLN13803.1 C4-dicarboxylate-binding periplasmic protein precursor [M